MIVSSLQPPDFFQRFFVQSTKERHRMKLSHTTIIFGTVLILSTPANTAPTCTGTCKNYTWNTAHNAFICATGTCQCTSTTTQPCWNPCDDDPMCGSVTWTTPAGYDNIRTSTYKQCQLNTSTSLCEYTTRNYVTVCASGYHSQGLPPTPETCISCAESTGNAAAKSNALYTKNIDIPIISAITQITDCYVPANTEFTFSDTTGTGIAYFKTDCTYTQ